MPRPYPHRYPSEPLTFKCDECRLWARSVERLRLGFYVCERCEFKLDWKKPKPPPVYRPKPAPPKSVPKPKASKPTEKNSDVTPMWATDAD